MDEKSFLAIVYQESGSEIRLHWQIRGAFLAFYSVILAAAFGVLGSANETIGMIEPRWAWAFLSVTSFLGVLVFSRSELHTIRAEDRQRRIHSVLLRMSVWKDVQLREPFPLCSLEWQYLRRVLTGHILGGFFVAGFSVLTVVFLWAAITA